MVMHKLKVFYERNTLKRQFLENTPPKDLVWKKEQPTLVTHYLFVWFYLMSIFILHIII